MDILRDKKLFKKVTNDLIELVKISTSVYPFSEIKEHAVAGSLKFIEAYYLQKLLNKYKPKKILEVGSFLGLSTRWILEVSRGWNAHLTAVDPNIRHRIFDDPLSYANKLNAEFLSTRLEIHEAFFGSRIKCPYYYYVYENYEPKYQRDAIDRLLIEKKVIDATWPSKFDFIFIDGEHIYESVINSFESAIALLMNKGCIVFHDALSHAGVLRVLNEVEIKYSGKARIKIYGMKAKIIASLLKRMGVARLGHVDGLGLFEFL